MKRVIDISVPLSRRTATWPGTARPSVERVKSLDSGDDCNDSYVVTTVHAGTHVDAPLHYIERGIDVTGLSLQTLVGDCWVAAVEGNAIGAEHLNGSSIPSKTERLLLRTENSNGPLGTYARFDPTFAALAPDGAK